MLKKLPFQPGLFTDDPPLTMEGRFVDGNNIRFYRGYAEPVGGWQVETTGIVGKARGGTAWVDNTTSTAYLGIGTHERLYAYSPGSLRDITPSIAPTSMALRICSMPAGSIYGSAPARDHYSVSWASHGFQLGQLLSFSGVSTAVGGATIAGEFEIVEVENENSFIMFQPGLNALTAECQDITADVVISVESQLSVRWSDGDDALLVDGDDAFILFEDRSWSLYRHTGGGREYGSFEYGWGGGTWGAGTWGTPREQGAWVHPSTWSMTGWGSYLMAAPRGGPIYRWRPSEDARAIVVTSAPNPVNYLFATNERFLVALGVNTFDAVPVFDPMALRTCRQGVETDWEISATSNAIFQQLSGGSTLVAGTSSRGQSLIWSDKCLFSMRYLGQGEFVYGFDTLGTSCGLIGPNAWAETDGIAFWLTPQGEFFLYDGSSPRSIRCPIRRRVLDSFVQAQSYAVCCGVNPLYSEFILWMPTDPQAPEVDVVCVYNYKDDTWSLGDWSRTTWIRAANNDRPFAVDPEGTLWRHEEGNDRPGTNEAFLQSAPFDIEDGGNVMRIKRLVIDRMAGEGDLTATLRTQRWALDTVEAAKELSFTPTERYRDTRLSGRTMDVRLAAPSTSDWWRVGDLRVDMVTGGRR